MKPTRIIWHHSAINDTMRQSARIDDYHKSRGFPLSSRGYYIGYHYLIEADGSVLQARETNEIGAHDAGENVDSIGVCLAGDFSQSMPTAAQCFAFGKLLRELTYKLQISWAAIEPHRRDDTTECPGRNLPDGFAVGLM